MDQPEQKKSAVDTILGSDTVFEGKVQSRGTLRIEGRVDGEIIAEDTVIIGPSGIVKANVEAAHISVSGQINGNIVAKKKLELHPTAVVSGDISTAVGALTVEPGAKIEGRCSMGIGKTAEGAQRTPPQAPRVDVPPRPAAPVAPATPAATAPFKS